MAEGLVVPTSGALLGRAELGAGAFGELWRTADGLRMIFDDSGTFDVIGRGRDIVWYPRAGCDAELARVDMLGRVLSLSLYEQGMMRPCMAAPFPSGGRRGVSCQRDQASLRWR